MGEIPLNHGRIALVDDEDYAKVSQTRWRYIKIKGCEYAATGDNTLMHRLILAAGPSDRIDHKDGNGLNNQRLNLRHCTHAQNMRNRRKMASAASRYKGVQRAHGSRGWTASIRLNGKRRHLGTFASESEAALAYDKAAQSLHGEYARTNF